MHYENSIKLLLALALQAYKQEQHASAQITSFTTHIVSSRVWKEKLWINPCDVTSILEIFKSPVPILAIA